jgi:DNA polymerase III subunit beta
MSVTITSPKTSKTKATKKKKPRTNTTTPNHLELQFNCDQATLNDYLDFVKAAVADKPTHPILGNILILADATTQQVDLISYNLEFGMQVSFEAKVEQSGQITLPKDILQQMVRRFPKGELTLEAWREASTNPEQEPSLKAILYSTDTERFEIRGMLATEFPELPTVKQKQMRLPANLLLTQINGSLFAASSDETKRILNSSHFRLDCDLERGLNSLTTWTTDGHRLVLIKSMSEGKTNLEQPVSFTVPSKVLKELERCLDPSEQVKIYYQGEEANSGIVAFVWGNQRLVSRTLDGQYPNCGTVIEPFKEQYSRQVIVERLALLRALERLAVLADKSMKVIRFQSDSANQRLHLEIEHKQVGKGQVTLDAQCSGDDLTLLFNVRYLLEVTKAVSSSDVRIKFADAVTPTLITAYGTPAQGLTPLEAEYILAPLQ